MAQRIVILGNGGHAKAWSAEMPEPTYGEVYYFQSIEDERDIKPGDEVHIGIGDLHTRKRLYEKYSNQIPNRGIQKMANIHVGPGVELGDNVLLNTGCQVDHDCKIGNHCVISPGTILCGEVTLGDCCFVGAGAIIVNGVNLEAGTFVPAGTLVCGQDDFRRPQRMVRTREVQAAMGETEVG